MMCWVSYTQMTSRPTGTAWHLTCAVRAMSLAMGALVAWMSTNRLRLNPSKTQFIWLGTRQQLAKLDLAALAADFPISLFFFCLGPWSHARPRAYLCSKIHRLCRDCYYQLRQLRTVARSLTPGATATLIHSFITARLDYCCSLYVGLPAGRLGCLDRVLRSAARLIGRIPRFGHISGYMLDVLHWLPSSSVSHTGLLLWYGGACWALPQPIFASSAALPQMPWVVAPSALPSRVCSSSLLPVHPLGRTAPFQSLVQRSGTGFPWRCACFPGSTPTHSIVSSKLSFLAVLGSGAPLS